ncbi:XRE family transcriptional regulator [Paenibacillus sp. PCH8]|uniref:helix-turn-helix domain-containing protein n=1 Tax=Paenibacillus sp. PCH8 TaxID=2066524 RepID=UPI000CF92D82|nr:helix-turn-helix transcriptional regulator [Paenibacillus sp. PCH8]PQP81023.1 XRE family transcriptional regulator [Paenibacillus sp. PCH8]
MKSIGEKLKYIRKLNKLNQTEFSQIIGVSQGALSDLEKDKYKPSLETVIALRMKFDIDLYWFIFEDSLNKSTEIFSVLVDDFESEFISDLRKLTLKDKQELEGILNLKLKRYGCEI